MILQSISLQHFRSYTKASFSFNPQLTVVVGPNAIGKTNLVEAICMLATGKSFRTSKELQLIAFGELVARVTGEIGEADDQDKIEIVVAKHNQGWLQKRYLINGVSKRRSSLAGKLPVVLFTPTDLDLVSGQPSAKRHFLNEVLEQSDATYAAALTQYSKALRQRNALLEQVQQTGRRDKERFAYWDNLLIKNGQYVTKQRAALIEKINQLEKKLFTFSLVYDHSIISEERLAQYANAEVGAGVTLVGPQRDDVQIQTKHPVSNELEDVKYFCSRGQQRLVTLELKKMQIFILKDNLEQAPLLVLDDIFSELDSSHIHHVLQLTSDYQTVITTTHKEFLEADLGKIGAVVELGEQHS